ncbi:hypothetical protein NST99_19020 [Paenibacillus sp. FSL L8-0470]|uniref:hypothetical protein n=1 Tax=unclassified Paenibacillus TaxID=185978 RepID=UPI0030F81635
MAKAVSQFASTATLIYSLTLLSVLYAASAISLWLAVSKSDTATMPSSDLPNT